MSNILDEAVFVINKQKLKVWFYGISNIVGYSMLNPGFTYILNI